MHRSLELLAEGRRTHNADLDTEGCDGSRIDTTCLDGCVKPASMGTFVAWPCNGVAATTSRTGSSTRVAIIT